EIQILISEVPGGSFGAYLLMEEMGVTYQKASSGAPILPLFRMDGSVPATSKGPPFDPNGLIWKPGTSKGAERPSL
ncbi:MAG TPA: hypothetical protein VF258_08855, partial [Luteolibacter sp.]